MRGAAARRAGSLGAILLLCVAGLGVRLGYVQAVRAESYAEEARQQRVRQIDLPARRGTIYDRLGGELAVSVPARTVYADPRAIADPAEAARQISEILGASSSEVEEELRKDRTFVYLARRIGVVTAERIESLRLPGIGILEEPRRVYPSESLAANVVGFIGTDQEGLGGMEYAFDKLLGGKPGHRVLEQDPRGRRIPQGIFVEEPPVAGSDILLTLHPDVQHRAEQALRDGVERTGAEGGMITVLEPRSGEILAMASSPTYDPNLIGEFEEIETRNRVVTQAFEPGSVNKIVTAAAALTEGAVEQSEVIEVPSVIRIADHEFMEEAGARPLDIRGILAESSNLGTIRIAQRLGSDTLRDYFSRLHAAARAA
jgi:cell division protein FtsI (penicillin-binding protein 3)